MFQAGAFMNFAFQTVGQGANDNGVLGGKAYPGSEDYLRKQPFSYIAPWDKRKEELKQKKTELDRVNAVIAENERKQAIAEQSRLQAISLKKKQSALRLETLQNELLNEITRLLAVRDEIMRCIKNDEAAILLMMMRYRRLRVA